MSLQLKKISKFFSGIKALDKVDFNLKNKRANLWHNHLDNSFTTIDAISIAVFVSESVFAMAIRPNSCVPISSESLGPLTV